MLTRDEFLAETFFDQLEAYDKADDEDRERRLDDEAWAERDWEARTGR